MARLLRMDAYPSGGPERHSPYGVALSRPRSSAKSHAAPACGKRPSLLGPPRLFSILGRDARTHPRPEPNAGGYWAPPLAELEGCYRNVVPRINAAQPRHPTGLLLGFAQIILKSFVTSSGLPFIATGNAGINQAAGVDLLIHPDCLWHNVQEKSC